METGKEGHLNLLLTTLLREPLFCLKQFQWQFHPKRRIKQMFAPALPSIRRVKLPDEGLA